MTSRHIKLMGCLVLLLGSASFGAQAQDTEALARKLANPIASLTSVPMQLNYDDGIGSLDAGEKLYLNEAPGGGPEWGRRFTFTLLFPRH